MGAEASFKRAVRKGLSEEETAELRPEWWETGKES